jgi:5-amino-6-(5-phosphoribosylamino)uracil reductase
VDQVALDQLHADLVLAGSPGAPAVSVNFVMSLNGAATGPDGRSGSLGGAADRVALRRVRDAADVVLAGGGTVRGENYGPVKLDGERRQRRAAKGLSPVPRLAVVTNSGVDVARLTGEGEPPIVLTADPDAPGGWASGADVSLLDAPITPAAIIEALAGRGLHRILCEGGPSLVQQLFAADAVDELFITIASRLVGGQVQLFPEPVTDTEFALVSAAQHDDDVLLRYRVRR